MYANEIDDDHRGYVSGTNQMTKLEHDMSAEAFPHVLKLSVREKQLTVYTF